VKITGAGFPVYKGKERLQRALINYFLDKNTLQDIMSSGSAHGK
jgi:seryl-tRNA synthetase